MRPITLHKNTLYFYSILLVFSLLLISCETYNNPKADAYIQKQTIIYQAENRSDLIVWKLDSENETYVIPFNGIDPIFLPTQTEIGSQQPYKSLAQYCNGLNLTSSERESIAPYIHQYEKLQKEIYNLTEELKSENINALKSYKSELLSKLNGGTLTQIQYDKLLTETEGTFVTNLRHKYNESKIMIASSTHLHQVLEGIEVSLSEKSWDRFVSLLIEE